MSIKCRLKSLEDTSQSYESSNNLLGDLLVCSCEQNITGRTRSKNQQRFYGCRSRDNSFLGKVKILNEVTSLISNSSYQL